MPKNGALERRILLFLCMYMEQKADEGPYTLWNSLPYRDNWYVPNGFFGIDFDMRHIKNDFHPDAFKPYFECTSDEPKEVAAEIKRVDAIYRDDLYALEKCGCRISEESENLDRYIFSDDPHAMEVHYDDSNNADYRELKERDFIGYLELSENVKRAAISNRAVRRTLFKRLSVYRNLNEFSPSDTRPSGSLSRLIRVIYDILQTEEYAISFTKKDYTEKYVTNERQMQRDIAVLEKFAVQKTINKVYIYKLAVKQEDFDV